MNALALMWGYKHVSRKQILTHTFQMDEFAEFKNQLPWLQIINAKSVIYSMIPQPNIIRGKRHFGFAS